MFQDNPDFYPTPRAVARRMLAKIQNKDAKYFLEPSAGKGDIADVIRRPMTFEEYQAENPRERNEDARDYRSAWRWSDEDRRGIQVDVVENYPDLVAVLRGKKYDVVGLDWLSYQGVSYYDAIIMNPPFSDGARHLLKAWEFLHGGEIVCLLNAETLANPYTEDRRRLARIIEQYGSVEQLGDCFSTAERRTGVSVAMVYLRKPVPDDAPDLWAKTGSQEKHHDVDVGDDPQMLAIRDNLGNMEHWFNMANEHWIAGIQHIRKAAYFMHQNKVTDRRGRNGEDLEKILALALSNVHASRAEFLRRHRRLAWTSVFEQMEFSRWLDSKQQERFMRDVERDSTIPFTAENIRATLENVFQSRKRLFEESVANVFDELCSHAVENGCGPVAPSKLRDRRSEGWKTNDSYKVNQRLIFPWGVERGFDGYLRPRGYGSGSSAVACADLDRILCVLDGKPFDKCRTVGQAVDHARPGQLVDSDYFEIRGYKKGTLHLKWKRLDLWERFNVTAAAGKKWLGENTQQYRPHKRKDGPDAEHWECRVSGHQFVDGICSRCKEPEVDEVEAVECELCRAIFEQTGELSCPLHPRELVSLPETVAILALP